jgi:hypothetical protein
MELFTATRKLKKFFFLTTRDVWYVHPGWHGTHRYDIQVPATHAATWVHQYSSLLQWSVPLRQRGHVARISTSTSHHCHVTSLYYWHRLLQQWRISMHPCCRMCGKNFNIAWMCAVSPVVHTSNISSCQKKLFQVSCGCEQFHYGRSFGFLVINVCNHGEHYETPCILRD